MKHMKLLIISAVLMGSLVFTGDLFAKVTRVYANVNPTSFKGKCPKKFEFTAKITVDSPGIVKYKWIRSDNANAPEKTIGFRKPGTRVVTTTWTIGKTYKGWQAVKILSPNPMTSNRAVFTLDCGVGCGIYFKSLSKTSGYPGDTFKMYGKWGSTQGTKTPCINKGSANKLIVLSWSNSVLNVKIPAGLAPGKYRVGVYCKFPITGPTGGSTWKDFTIKSRIVRPVKPLKPARAIKPGVVKPRLTTRGCPDPAAHEIRFRILSRDSSNRFKGRVRITGIVKNIGSKAFIAGSNQAKAYLYEVPMGSSSGRVLAQRAITRLAPGATVQLTYERDWYSSSPSEGEFPPTFRLLISLDPDIYMDASKDNDDCTQDNNKKDRSGSEINDMFSR